MKANEIVSLLIIRTMTSCKKILLLCILGLLSSMQLRAQLLVDTTATPIQLLEMLLGQGVTVSNLQYRGDGRSKGVFRNGKNTELGIDSGIVLTTGYTSHVANPVTFHMSNVLPPNTGDDDPDLNALAGSGGHDATVIEFDFVPLYDTIEIRYVFGSEEYPNYACTQYNDIFAFFLSGPNPAGGNYIKTNIAKIPNSNYYVAINSVNKGPGASGGKDTLCIPPCYLIPPTLCTYPNSVYYVDNQGLGGAYITFNGFTVTLTAFAVVVPCQSYHIKIAIQEHGDNGSFDSGVFLEAGSFSSPGVTVTPIYSTPGNAQIAVEGCSYATLQVALPFTLPTDFWFVFDSIAGSATNGIDCNFINDSIYFAPGEILKTIQINPIADGIPEPDETLIFYYSSNACTGSTVSSIQVVFANFQDIELGIDTLVCQGSPVILDAGPGWKTYLWNTGATTQTISPISSGTYTVDVTDAYGCASSDTRELTIAPLPPSQLIKHN